MPLKQHAIADRTSTLHRKRPEFANSEGRQIRKIRKTGSDM